MIKEIMASNMKCKNVTKLELDSEFIQGKFSLKFIFYYLGFVS